MTRWLGSFLSPRRRGLALGTALLAATGALVQGQNVLSSYRGAAQAYREAAAKAPADERACYLAWANYYDCVAATLGPNPPRSCTPPPCTPGSTDAGGQASNAGSGGTGGTAGTTPMIGATPEQQLASAMEQTFSALAESSNARAAERNARQRAIVDAANNAREAERLRQEQAEADRREAVTKQFLDDMQRTFVPVAFGITASAQPGGAANSGAASATSAYVQSGIRALDAIDFKTAAARFSDALNFGATGDDVRLAAAASLVLTGEYRQATQQLSRLQQSANATYARQGSDLFALLSTRSESFRWELIRNSRNRDDVAAFLRDYPIGAHFTDAQGRFFELDATKRNEIQAAANTHRFVVIHNHPGFGDWPSGVVTVAPGRVVYEETGKVANLDDNFDVSCREIDSVGGNNLAWGRDKIRLHLRNRNYTFIGQSKEAAAELVEGVKSACGFR